jgi:tetratricopeptide (TPR) repeat protein
VTVQATIGRLLQAGFAQQQKGQFDEARALYAQVLALDPRNFDALQLSGLCALQAGDNATALQFLDGALALRQDVASVFNHRGVVLRRLGEGERALADFSRVAALDPRAANAFYNRANTLRDLGRLGEALGDYRRAAGLAPRRADILNNLGGCLKELNLHAEALACYDRLLALNPDHAEAHSNRGLVLQNLGRFEDALASADRAIAINPSFVDARRERGAALLALGRLEDALEALDKALSLDPRHAAAHATRGMALMEMGRPEEATRSFETSLALKPGYADARLGLAKLAAEEGRFGAAETLFESVRRDDPGNVGSLHGLSGVKKFTAGDPLFAAIAGRLDDATLTAEQREQLHHAYAKISNDAGRYDEAMAHFALSKACRPSRFDIAAHRASFAAMRQVFTPSFFAARTGFGLDDERPVFVVGMPRSGTTLTEQIISAHPAVRGFGELQDLPQLAKTLGGGPKNPQGFAAAVTGLDAAGAAGLARRYSEAWRGAESSLRRLVDKRPHNYELLGLIALMFPRARIIHCRRNAMDNCLSMYMQDFNVHHGYNRDLATLGQYYRAYEELMAHWREVLPLPIHDCVYEDTVDDLEGTARRLIDFLGLAWDPVCLDYYKQERQVRTPSQWQVRQPVYRSSVEAWRRHERHLGPLKAALEITS